MRTKKEDIKNHLDHLTNRNKLLLEERSQQIDLANLICIEHNPQNEHWRKVSKLFVDIDILKTEVINEEEKKREEALNYDATKIARFNWESVTKKEDDSQSFTPEKFSSGKRKIDVNFENIDTP